MDLSLSSGILCGGFARLGRKAARIAAPKGKIMKIQFGATVTDQVTGLTGVVTARTEYMSGCVHYCLEYLQGGKPETTWLDAGRLGSDEAGTGGPMPAPPQLKGA